MPPLGQGHSLYCVTCRSPVELAGASLLKIWYTSNSFSKLQPHLACNYFSTAHGFRIVTPSPVLNGYLIRQHCNRTPMELHITLTPNEFILNSL